MSNFDLYILKLEASHPFWAKYQPGNNRQKIEFIEKGSYPAVLLYEYTTIEDSTSMKDTSKYRMWKYILISTSKGLKFISIESYKLENADLYGCYLQKLTKQNQTKNKSEIIPTAHQENHLFFGELFRRLRDFARRVLPGGNNSSNF